MIESKNKEIILKSLLSFNNPNMLNDTANPKIYNQNQPLLNSLKYCLTIEKVKHFHLNYFRKYNYYIIIQA